ncbi:MAG: phosphatidylserine decarboxylase [Rhodospirillales bacterium]|nr:phosphatidylserine decarboxylase [Rhodospirillales bacterium]MDP6882627.1 phosphatidylserine decarboxylase [Rhodospirillales bacterium]
MRTILVPINRAGWPFIALFAGATLVIAWLATPAVWIGVVLTAWCIYFFRDPDRVTPTREGLIVAAADGVVQTVDTAVPPAELDMSPEARSRVCVFMNVFNVHVNRIPCSGTIAAVAYRPGRFFNASLDKASEHNERNSLRVVTTDGMELACVQIAGLIARRTVCDVTPGENVLSGQRMGIIRFGSRVDIYLPPGVAPLVGVGQRSVAGETVLADLRSQEPARDGEIR